jgi:predicted ATP-dependent endonuclease of OLD family
MSTPSKKGKKAAYTVKNIDSIPLDAMGEGVANLLGFIVDLCIAEDKLFLVEEPENDIHPKALKGLLKLIAEKAGNNQFVITTHSNIVTKYLGAETGSKVFSVQTQFVERIPTSEVEEVDTFESRREVMEALGYELSDFGLWDSWLLLEEASAERIIKEYLIPEHVPSLQGKLRTFSARTISEVKTKFDDFNRLFVFLHLQPTYKDRAWVIVDAGHDGDEVIQKLKQTYVTSGWDESHFQQFAQPDFEKYYPASFQERADTILALTDRKVKREGKQALLDEVLAWIEESRQEAKVEFGTSASEVIEKLRAIEIHLENARL